MSLTRWPVYAWIGGGCPDDCPDIDDPTPWGCRRPEHETVHLWVRDRRDTDDEVYAWDPVWYRTDGLDNPSHPGFVSGVAIRGDVFDDIVGKYLAMRAREGHPVVAPPRALQDPPARRCGAQAMVEAACVAAGVWAGWHLTRRKEHRQ